MRRLVIALFFFGCAAQAATEPVFTPYQDSAGKVVRLATEESHPFLFQGWKVDQNHQEKHKKRWRGIYRPSIKEYSSVLDCLTEKSRKMAQPDLTQIDWRKIDTNEDAAVCLFRVASSYATPKDMEEWMKKQGFRTTMIMPVKSDKKRGPIVSGGWNVKERGPIYYSNWFFWLTQRVFVYATSFSVHYDSLNVVVYAHSGQNSL